MNETSSTSEVSAATPRAETQSKLWLFAKIAISVLAIAYVAHLVKLDQLLSSFSQVTFTAGATALGLFVATFWLGAIRFALILRTFGADRTPSLLYLFRLYLYCLFFNTFLPGAVVGDVMRGVVVRNAFEKRATTSGVAVVFFERVMGLLGLFMVVSLVSVWRPVVNMPGLSWFAALIAVAAFAGALVFAYSGRFARHLPRALAEILKDIPEPRSLLPLVTVVLLSAISHGMVAVAGHALLATLHTSATLSDSMVVIPTAAAAAFIPISIAGAGLREAAFVALYARLHVAASDALVVSLGLFTLQAVTALLGAALAFVFPLGKLRADEPT